MKKLLLILLTCCACAAVVGCDDDDDEVVYDSSIADDSEKTDDGDEAVDENAPTVSVEATASTNYFFLTLVASKDASNFGYVACTEELTSVTAEQILSGSVSEAFSAETYTTETYFTKSAFVEADKCTKYYVYAAAVTADGIYSAVASTSVTTILTSAEVTYYGTYYSTTGLYQYSLTLSDNSSSDGYDTGARFYYLDFWSSTGADSGDIALPAGTYTVGTAEAENAIYSDDLSFNTYAGEWTWGESGYIIDGTLTVSVSDGTTYISGTLTDGTGGVHTISYSGVPSFEDSSTYSSLTEDITPDLTGASFYAAYYGDLYGTGAARWYVQVLNMPGSGIILDLCGDASFTTEAGMPTGTFTGDTTGAAGTYYKGKYNSGLDHSWFYTIDSQYYQVAPTTPLGSGTITVTNNNDGTYTIVLDVMDENDKYSIKTSWTGETYFYDMSSFD